MPTPDQSRIAAERTRPRITELWWALRPLTSVIRFMQSGAHPDDEMSGMLAALAFRDGINLSYACSTRGEGGQNDIGTESGSALGALRTREMERACDILGMRMYWLSETQDDPITDFGFSKSGAETLGRWGRDRTLARFVEIVRTERPDILAPTFLDVPGQHGHHRAMTRAAHQVIAAAADPAFPSNLPPWRIRKLYLPAMSGAGQAYDDAEPPPPATLTIDGSGADPVTGWTWNRIGQHSRAFHRTQGMGRTEPLADGRDWLLHLAEAHVPGPDRALSSGLPATLSDLARLPGAEPVADALTRAQGGIDAAIAAFPDGDRIAAAAAGALAAVRAARDACPPGPADEIRHRLEAKDAQLCHLLRIARGIEIRVRTEDAFLRPGQSTTVTLEHAGAHADGLDLTCDLPPGWSLTGDRLTIGPDARPSDPYPNRYDPVSPDAPALRVRFNLSGTDVETRVAFEAPPMVLPARSAMLTPDALLVNRTRPHPALSVDIARILPPGAAPEFGLPDGWSVTLASGRASIAPPPSAPPGLYDLPLRLDGAPAATVRTIAYPHTAPTVGLAPATLRIRILDAGVPETRVGYIGAGNDRVDHWLAALGADVTALDDAAFTSDAALSAYDTIVIGIFAMRFRAGLAAAMPALHRWTRSGGTLVTLYHRPWDNWDPDATPPLHLEIGQPSLRWRVTDETAPVRHIAAHDILSTPNRIGPEDWDGWVKERGLYFAKSWDPAYVPLVEMADPDETPLKGALLAADIGEGRHVHTALILHHQMENLVPGAFRLMANMIARRS